MVYKSLHYFTSVTYTSYPFHLACKVITDMNPQLLNDV